MSKDKFQTNNKNKLKKSPTFQKSWAF